MSASIVKVTTARQVVEREDGERPLVVTSQGPDPVYYGGATVSSVSNDGSLTTGGSVTFRSRKWFVSSGKTRLVVEPQDQDVSVGNSGAAKTLYAGPGLTTFRVTLTANTTLTIDADPGAHITLLLTQDAAGGRTVTISHAGATASAASFVSSTAGATSVVRCWVFDEDDATNGLVFG